MTAEQFCYWMQGFAELNEAPPTAEQWKSMREHLATVFVKVTPRVGGIPETPNANPPRDWIREVTTQRPAGGIPYQALAPHGATLLC